MIFSDPAAHSDGWSAVAGEDAIMISGTQDLSSDVIWMTNLGYDLTAMSGFGGHGRFRRSDYLKSGKGVDRIMDEMGVADPHHQAKIGADLLSRVMHLSERYLGMRQVPVETLRKGVIQNSGVELPVNSPPLQQALKESTTYFASCEAPAWADNTTIVRFTLPRLEHASRLLLTPIPVGRWNALRRQQLPRGRQSVGQRLMDWIMDLPGPALARVVVERCDELINPLINFGTGLSHDAKRRGWVSSPELILLAEFADIKINAVYLCDKVAPPPYADLVGRCFKDPANDLSVSVGLFAENLWQGISSSARRNNLNPLTPFLRADDRMICLAKAIHLARRGYTVKGYGSGMVTVQVPDEGFGPELLKTARELSLIPPYCALGAEQDDIRPGAPPIEALQSLYARGEFDQLMAMDTWVMQSFHEFQQG